mmetsp:Transcript_45362/g.75348  ORF Transcript_45362/g.75348 Transcript_45362/m.75348 type:complete len:83 (+) Transcript_45362:320-568(+)
MDSITSYNNASSIKIGHSACNSAMAGAYSKLASHVLVFLWSTGYAARVLLATPPFIKEHPCESVGSIKSVQKSENAGISGPD